MLVFCVWPAALAEVRGACAQLSSLQAIYKSRPESVGVDYIYDGDTLRLRDGRRVRLLGVNTPELARDERPAQALAEEAHQAVKRWVTSAQGQHLLVGPEAKDRYGRVLGHLFDDRGHNLEAALLAQGLAFAIVVPPNDRHGECFMVIERQARLQKLGIWGHVDWQPLPARRAVAEQKAGFQRIAGQVTRVDRGKTLWVELDQALVLRVDTSNNPDFWQGFSSNLLGRQLVVRGWLTQRKLSNPLKAKGFKEWLMNVRSPYSIERDQFSQ